MRPPLPRPLSLAAIPLLLFAAATGCTGGDTTTPTPARTVSRTPQATSTRPSTRTATPAETPVEGLAFAIAGPDSPPSALEDALASAGNVQSFPSLGAAQDAAGSRDNTYVIQRVAAGDVLPRAATVLFAAPTALFVPFTFHLEDVTAADADALASGSIANWSDVGGPAGAVTSVDGPANAVMAGDLAVAAWSGPERRVKPLRVGGLAPDDPGYSFADRWVAVGAPLEVTGLVTVPVPKRDYATVAAVGDMMFARTVGDDIAADGADYPFAEAARLLDADVTFGNLESVLSDRGTPADKGFTFEGDPAVAKALAKAGFDVVSIANNHSMDFGPDAFLDTISHLDDAGVKHAGGGADRASAHKPAIVKAHGLTIAFLAYGAFIEEPSFPTALQEAGVGKPGIAWADASAIAADVAAAKQDADVVVVYMHSGLEYTSELWQTQIDVAHEAIDAGAALVLASGPHVLQGIEYYGDGVIAYSLGNFIFDFDEQDRAVPGMPSALSGVLVVALDKQGVRGLEFRPAFIAENRPAPATPEQTAAVEDWFYPLVDALAP